jgi:predicted ribosome quality control (RQC) complex YloA/Tae2 family protein
VGTEGARLVIAESVASGRSPGEVLAGRLADLEAGRVDPVIEAEHDEQEDLEGVADLSRLSLLPWAPLPGTTPRGRRVIARQDAAATAGAYHECVERVLRTRERSEALVSILRGEIARLERAEARAASDLAGFEERGRHRVYGEALLAGLRQARRVGDHVLVPDPYDPEGNDLRVPAPASQSLTASAEEHFRKERRARRGYEAATARLQSIRARRDRLDALCPADPGSMEVDSLLHAMRALGIPVGLEPSTRKGRAASQVGLPKLEGVRVLTSKDGFTILVGRTGRDNDRLTFRLAGPEDFWLHAKDVPGAHVIVRNPRKERELPRATLEEAAAAAAWYSDARAEEAADVQWTRRKNVRRVRGAPRGTVTVKRFETIRVRPASAPDREGPAQNA